jgi:hypothetical protein
MHRDMTVEVLAEETQAFHGSGGISAESRSFGFHPAFRDTQTDVVYLSCFADGRRAPCHLLDGLPDELVVARGPAGRVAAIKESVISGFVRMGRFYTREQAALAVSLESFVVAAA